MIALFAGLLCTALAAPEAGTEFVIVLDNSCSMVEPHSSKEKERKPAADPDRRAVLGAQIVQGLTEGTRDDLSVLAFPLRKKTGFLQLNGAEELRDVGPSSGTYFRGPLAHARSVFERSSKRDKMLVVLSDGAPTDFDDPAIGRQQLGLDEPDSQFDTLVLGLFRDEAPNAERFMRAMARQPSDYHRVDQGEEVVSHFTRAYAHALGSRALTGTLPSGGTHRFEVGKYVTEVLAATTTVDKSGPYSARLKEASRTIPVKAKGDNGCTRSPPRNPTYCAGPRMHFQVWRAQHDPARPSTWTLDIPQAGGDIAYGVILRYDLLASVDVSTPAKIDTPSPIRAKLEWNGRAFDDADFFGKDGFEAVAYANGQRVPLTHSGGGVFEGNYTPTSSRPVPVTVQFTNTWMSKVAQGVMTVVKPPALELTTPGVLDFGDWRGGRWATTSCREFTVGSNHPFDVDTLTFDFEGLPDGSSITLDPSDAGWTVCARAKGCCGDLLTDGVSAIVVSAVDDEGSRATQRIAVRYTVDGTGFLWCWWPWLLGLLLLLVLLWFLYGWIRPNDFDEDLTVKVAGSERQLSRSAALVLREQPRGRRGFYRNARVSLTHAGDFVAKQRSAAVWFEATGSGDTQIHLQGPLEVKDRRTKKWTLVEPGVAADGIRTNIVYRLGDIYIRFQ